MSYKGQGTRDPLRTKPKAAKLANQGVHPAASEQGSCYSSAAGCETVATEYFHSPLLPIRRFYYSGPVLSPSSCAGCAEMGGLLFVP